MRKSAVLLAFLVAACGSQTTVQRGYNGDRDKCQSVSEERLPMFLDESRPVNLKERNAKLVTLFSDCMFEHGWTVATPTRAGRPDFKADPGVGVGASVRPGRFADEPDDDDDFVDPAFRRDIPAPDPSPLAPQNQGAVVETPDMITNQGGPGLVRKVPVENIGQ